MEIKYQNLRVLGPAILKVKIPDEILNKLNEYIDKIINDDTKLKKLNYGEALVGDVTQEFLLEVEFVKSSGWLEFLGNSCKIYTEFCLHLYLFLELAHLLSHGGTKVFDLGAVQTTVVCPDTILAVHLHILLM